MFSISVAPVSWSPAVPRASSTCWQKPCVVVTVAASKTASASSRRRRRTATSAASTFGEVDEEPVLRRDSCRVGQGVADADEALPYALAQLARRLAAEADDEQLVHGGHAFGDVARDQCRDGERLAGACAGLEHGRALGQRTQQVERRRRVDGRRHVCTDRLVGEQPVPQPPGEQPEPVRLVRRPAPAALAGRGLLVGEDRERRVGAVDQDVLGVCLLAGEPVGQPPLLGADPGAGVRVPLSRRKAYSALDLTGSGSGERRPVR